MKCLEINMSDHELAEYPSTMDDTVQHSKCLIKYDRYEKMMMIIIKALIDSTADPN